MIPSKHTASFRRPNKVVSTSKRRRVLAGFFIPRYTRGIYLKISLANTQKCPTHTNVEDTSIKQFKT